MNITPEQKNNITETIKRIIAPMNVECEVSIREEIVGGNLPAGKAGKEVVFASISAPEDAKFLIGKNGQNLQALEHIVRSLFLKQGENLTLFVDVNDYKKSRATHVATLAKEAVMRVRNTQRPEALTPMSPYERRIVHMELASVSDVTTESIGQEPQRRIVVKPYRS
ncbi:MAG: R3H domain-containing nucleic acid-binding protein [bacterium]|nr:R3H domain-containing nucleic acid-binding protein [bacterium]